MLKKAVKVPNNALSGFQVDLKQNRLRSTKLVVKVSEIDSTRLGSLKSTPVDLNRLTPITVPDISFKQVELEDSDLEQSNSIHSGCVETEANARFGSILYAIGK